MNDELERIWKEAVVTPLNVLSRHCLEGLMKTTKIVRRGSRSPGRDLNPGTPEYEGVLTTQQRPKYIFIFACEFKNNYQNHS
jgi:hypothetical protein